ncbi:MAG: energy transducer TonB [Gemmatimonadaceae bacterium]
MHFSRVGSTIVAVVLTATAVAGCAGNPRPRHRVAPTADVAACLDSLPAADSVSTVIKMTVSSQDPKKLLPRDFESMFSQEFRSHFKLPARLPLNLVMGTQPCDSLGSRCAGGVLSVGAIAYATLHDDGKLSDVEVIDASLTRDLTDSVTAALKAMSKAALALSTGEAESIPLAIQIGPDDNPDTVPAIRYVFRAKVPRYDFPFTYASMPAAGVDAQYPFTARLAGVGDSVMLAFTVRADGTIAPQSIQLMNANYRDFVSAVFDALEKTRYHAAHLGDCAVATRVTQRFLFKVPE